jgi:hypothetical protein
MGITFRERSDCSPRPAVRVELDRGVDDDDVRDQCTDTAEARKSSAKRLRGIGLGGEVGFQFSVFSTESSELG